MEKMTTSEIGFYTADSRISDVRNDPVFGAYGRLIFPADTWYCRGNTLRELDLAWYSCIDPKKRWRLSTT